MHARILSLVALHPLGALLLLGARATAADCNANGTPDEVDLEPRLRFAAASARAVGRMPVGGVPADLNGDGRPDLAVACGAGSKLSVALAGPGGELLPAAEHAAREGQRAIAAGDLDGDGDVDLGVAGSTDFASGWLLLLAGDGAGGLGEPVSIAAPAPWIVLAAADLDADGRVDLATLDRTRDALAVLWSTAQGFERGAALPTGRAPVALAALDLDGDGQLDIGTVAELSTELTLYWGDGRRGFDPTRLPLGRIPNLLAAVDWNGDALPDLATAHRAALELRILINGGGRELRSGWRLALESDPVELTAFDADGDGDDDLAALVNGKGPDRPVDTSYELHSDAEVVLGAGDGAIAGRRTHLLGPAGTALWGADVTGDGRGDLIGLHTRGRLDFFRRVRPSSDAPGSVSVLRSAPGGEFEGALRRPMFSRGKLAAADLDGDRRIDLALPGDTFLAAWVMWNKADRPFADRWSVPGGNLTVVLAADFDGDAHADLAVNDRPAPWESDPSVTVLRWGRGDGTFDVAEPLPPLGFRSIAADCDDDGRPDILSESGRAVAFLWNRNARTFEAGEGPTFEREIMEPATGDLDGDAKLDLAVIERAEFDLSREPPDDVFRVLRTPGKLAFLRGEGRGSFGEPVRLDAPGAPSALALADFDAQEGLDVAATDEVTGELLVWSNRGQLRFEPLARRACGRQPLAIAAGDLDGDGDLDLAAAAAADATVHVFANHGDGSFGDPHEFAVDGVPHDLLALDLDGSGRIDLVAATGESYNVWVLRNLSQPAAATDCNQNGIPDSCDIASGAALDDDGDGVADDCVPRFRRGDANGDGSFDLSDAIHTLGFLFLGQPAALGCEGAADVDASRRLDLSDAIASLGHLFLATAPPAQPYPACGRDFAPSALPCIAGTECGGQ